MVNNCTLENSTLWKLKYNPASTELTNVPLVANYTNSLPLVSSQLYELAAHLPDRLYAKKYSSRLAHLHSLTI